MAKSKPQPIEEAKPKRPVDVMKRSVPALMLPMRFYLTQWLDEHGSFNDCDEQAIDFNEYYLCQRLVEVMRHGGWAKDFLWRMLCDEAYVLQYGPGSRLTPEGIAQLAQSEFEKANRPAA